MGDGKSANLIRGCAESFAHCGRYGVPCGGHLFRRNAQVGLVGESVELSGIAEQSTVAPLAHIGHDALDGGQHGIERSAAAIVQGQRASLLFVVRLGLWSG